MDRRKLFQSILVVFISSRSSVGSSNKLRSIVTYMILQMALLAMTASGCRKAMHLNMKRSTVHSREKSGPAFYKLRYPYRNETDYACKNNVRT